MNHQSGQSEQIGVKEVKRQKIYVPKSMTTRQVMKMYGLKQEAAYNARKKGFFVKNYSSTQVCVDPSKFNTDICYRIAGKVFKSNLSRDPVARSIREDLIQEAVKSMWEKSGLLKESGTYPPAIKAFLIRRSGVRIPPGVLLFFLELAATQPLALRAEIEVVGGRELSADSGTTCDDCF